MALDVVPAHETRRKPVIHTAAEFAQMRVSGQLAAAALDYITPHVVPGISTGELDRLCHDFIVSHGAIPAPLGYRGFPKSICTSINEVICHGIPDDARILQEGDILNIDVTTIVEGWHGDTSRMFWVGKVSNLAHRLVYTTYQAMMAGIETIRPGSHLGDIGYAIERIARKKGFSVVREFCGHGVGRIFHDAPTVLHYGQRGEGMRLVPGLIFTVEPMINEGGWKADLQDDGWTALTEDRSLSAQFEHTVGVTESGFEIFTLSPKGWHRPPYPL